MSRVCLICTHINRKQIESDLITDLGIPKISAKYDVPEQSLRNHKANHLSRQLVTAHRIKEERHGMDLLSEMESVISRTKRILDKAEDDDLPFVALSAIGQLRSSIELMGKFLWAASQEQLQEQRTPLDLSKLTDEELHILGKIGQKVPGAMDLPKHGNYGDVPSNRNTDARDRDRMDELEGEVEQEVPKRKGLTRRKKPAPVAEVKETTDPETPTKQLWQPAPGQKCSYIDGIPQEPMEDPSDPRVKRKRERERYEASKDKDIPPEVRKWL